MRNKLPFIIILTVLVLLTLALGLRYFVQPDLPRPAIIDEIDEPPALEPISSFEARVLNIDNNQIEVVTTVVEIDGQKPRLTVKVTEATEILQGEVEEIGGVIKMVYQEGGLHDLKPDQELQIFSDGNIRVDQQVNALNIRAFPLVEPEPDERFWEIADEMMLLREDFFALQEDEDIEERGLLELRFALMDLHQRISLIEEQYLGGLITDQELEAELNAIEENFNQLRARLP